MKQRDSSVLIRYAGVYASALHLLKIATLFRGVEWSTGFSLVNVDYIQYFARVLRAHRFLEESGRFWGYDPFQMAGYISGPFLAVGTYLMSLVAHSLTPLIPISASVTVMIVGGFIAAPYCIWAMVRNFGGTSHHAWVAFMLTVLMVSNIEPLSALNIRIGLFGYQMAAFVAVWQVSLVWKWAQNRSPKNWAVLTLVSCLVFQIHPAILLVVLIPNLFIYVTFFGSLKRPHHLSLLAGVLLVFVSNWYWIHPFVFFIDWLDTAPYFISGGIEAFLQLFSLYKYRQFHPLQSVLLSVCLGLAISTIIRKQKKDRHFFIFILVWLVSLFVIAFYGSALPALRSLQPGRTVFPMWLLVFSLAGFSFVDSVLPWLKKNNLMFAVFLLIGLLTFSGWVREGAANQPNLTNRLPEEQKEFIQALAKSTYKNSRVLLECDDSGPPHFGDVIPHFGNQALLGGPHPGVFIKTNTTIFTGEYMQGETFVTGRPKAFGHYLEDLETDEFTAYMKLYNVGAVAITSESLRRELKRFTRVLGKPVKIGDHLLFATKLKPSWFWEGNGTVSFDYDKIVIDKPSRGTVILKFHYVDIFKTLPPVPIKPVYLKDDPIPFISVDNSSGADNIVVYNAGL